MQPVDLVIVLVTMVVVIIGVTALFAFLGRVPYVPTPGSTARAMVTLARLKGNEKVFDLGAGNGRILIEAKRMHPSLDATGIEFSPTVWLLGIVTILLSGQRVAFFRRDARKIDLRDADAIFLYLSPHLMAQLEDKFDQELRPGTVVISHAFRFPRRQPVEVTKVQRWNGLKTILRYEW
ncbi:hypothetical protein EXS70_02505 [Candidatus Peribacteria bacterium]|nr:hypothetical protein [Candidatus Peribacteria bacterium]